MGDRLGQEALDQDVDRLVEGRGEQQSLALAGRLVHDAAHAGQEAQVGHVVGLVEDGDLDVGEVGVALTHEVLEAAGAGDDDVDAALEGGGLRALAHAAVDDDGRETGRLGERDELGVDLADELTGRREDHGAGLARHRGHLARVEAGDQREEEGERLAGAGTAPAEDVAAGEAVGQRRGLDGSGSGDALLLQDASKRSGHAEFGEVHVDAFGWRLANVSRCGSGVRASEVREDLVETRPAPGARLAGLRGHNVSGTRRCSVESAVRRWRAARASAG